MNKTENELDNLKICIKSLKGEKDPLNKYHAICCIDDIQVRSALMWLAGIEVYSIGPYPCMETKYIITSELEAEYESNTDYWYEQALAENDIHYDDVDRLGERGFEIFVETKGILIRYY